MTKEIRPLAGDDLLGKLARRLRNLVCGEAGHMLQKNNIHKYAPAFAYLQQEYKCSASFADYVHWVRRVADCEYADELVLSATAEMLQLELVVVPYTPVGSDSPWSVWNSQSLLHSARDAPRILLGNDDVHYVLLFLTCSITQQGLCSVTLSVSHMAALRFYDSCQIVRRYDIVQA